MNLRRPVINAKSAHPTADALGEARELLEVLANRWEVEAARSWGETKEHATLQRCADELHALLAADARRSAQVPDGVVWRDQYRIQTAMRYMDNAPRLTLDEAYRMADHDIRGLERAAATVAIAKRRRVE